MAEYHEYGDHHHYAADNEAEMLASVRGNLRHPVGANAIALAEMEQISAALSAYAVEFLPDIAPRDIGRVLIYASCLKDTLEHNAGVRVSATAYSLMLAQAGDMLLDVGSPSSSGT